MRPRRPQPAASTRVVWFFFLKDGTQMWNCILRWLRGERRAKLAESIDRGSQNLGGYVHGTAAIALVDAVLAWALIQVWSTGYQVADSPRS